MLIALGGLGRIELLVQRFPGGISVPLAVWREVVETGRGRPGANAVATASWISVEAVRDASRARIFALTLDEGESEALALAVEKSADVVLLDEKDARQMAEKNRTGAARNRRLAGLGPAGRSNREPARRA